MFYDVNNGPLEEPEDVYIPFGWSVALELDSAGNTNGWKPEDIKTYQQLLNAEVRLDPDVGRAAGRGEPRPFPGLHRQLRAAAEGSAAATSGRSTTA